MRTEFSRQISISLPLETGHQVPRRHIPPHPCRFLVFTTWYFIFILDTSIADEQSNCKLFSCSAYLPSSMPAVYIIHRLGVVTVQCTSQQLSTEGRSRSWFGSEQGSSTPLRVRGIPCLTGLSLALAAFWGGDVRGAGGSPHRSDPVPLVHRQRVTAIKHGNQSAHPAAAPSPHLLHWPGECVELFVANSSTTTEELERPSSST